jgi:lipoprotein-releasing system ATP-binding protein
MTIKAHSGKVRVENLHHAFWDGDTKVDVLRGVSLDARSGEITSIVGPSGCGKSTLLYLMGLLDRPNRGKIFFNDFEVQDLSDQERTKVRNQSVGFVFQFHFLIKELTVLENVRLPLLKNGTEHSSADEKSMDLLDELGLKKKSHRPAFKLSGGEQQRVAIARALANSPQFLFADEPTGNLDTQNSESVFQLLLQMAKKRGLAVILVTHNEKIAALSDTTLQMEDGMIIS